MPSQLPPLSLYIHIPWCIQKCPYCDFNSHQIKNSLPEIAYVEKLLEDLAADIAFFNIERVINSIFIGGGTPSLLSPTAMARLLEGVKSQLQWHHNIEITMEANPNSVESAKFAEFRLLGINRLSIGIQSFNNRHLKKLGRVHSAKEAITAIESAQHAGFDNLNLDLMFGLPEQTLDESISDLQQALNFKPQHLSLYQLTLEPNTYFHKFPPVLPKDELIFQAQKDNQHLLANNHYQQYEVSAYAQQGKQCLHNRNYWQFGDYLGIGAGAHGKISLELPHKIYRTLKPKQPEQYLTATQLRTDSIININELALEFVMNQLRLKRGFSVVHYQAVTGLSAKTLEPALSESVREGLLIQQQQDYFCSKQGWLFLDSILEKFIC